MIFGSAILDFQISDPWFLDRKEKIEERLANCPMKGSLLALERPVNWKERAMCPDLLLIQQIWQNNNKNSWKNNANICTNDKILWKRAKDVKSGKNRCSKRGRSGKRRHWYSAFSGDFLLFSSLLQIWRIFPVDVNSMGCLCSKRLLNFC
jgi:hypothetical protein